MPDLTVEQAFELSDATVERSAGGCTIELSEASVAEYMEYATEIDSMAPEIYRYLNFDRMDEFVESARRGRQIAVELVA